MDANKAGWDVKSNLAVCVFMGRETNVPGKIVNSDQGCQFTGGEWIAAVRSGGGRVSHDGRGRALDNLMVERLWRSVKYEDIYLRDYGDPAEARTGLGRYCGFKNTERPHPGLDYRTPLEVMKGAP